MTLLIPRLLHQIWVGPKPPPVHWMNSWKFLHPEWMYVIWGNDELNGRRWRLQRAIDHYSSKAIWSGVADCMRYEILHEYGGFMPGADCVCERPVDELFSVEAQDDWEEFERWPRRKPPHAWGVYEHEVQAPGFITPVYAAEPRSDFCDMIMFHIEQEIEEFDDRPWISVGNKLMGDLYREREASGDGKSNLTVWPSWYFNPEHHTGVKHIGTGVPYGRQLWGSTKGLYR